MPLADTLKKEPGDILQSDDWNVIIKEIDRLETAKINRDGADTLKGPLTIAEALNANSNVTIKGSLSIVVPQPQEPSGQILVLGPTNASNLRLGYHQDYSWIQSHGSKPLLINRLGNNIGIGSTINPVARLDIASATRTGTHPTAVKGLYITGDFNADNDGVEFRHSNGTQGIGFGFNTIYATGSHPNQDLQLKPKGTGVIAVSGDLSVTGSVTPSVGNSENNGIMFPKDPGGGGGDAAWIRYYVRGGEATTFEIGTSNDSDDHIALMPNAGNVGIGTPNPNKGKLHIEGSVEYVDPRGYQYLTNKTGTKHAYSLYASDRIGCTEFNAFSDLRIKEIKGTSDSQADLQTLLQIQVTDYYYKDKIAKGNRPKKKVIGQQIATVYSQAVSTHVDTVPDILEFAIIEENWVTLNNHNLKIGDKVKIFWNNNDSQLFTVEETKTDQFKISLNRTGDIFVYGREVDDFHVVDYDALSMLHISATQELYKIIKKLEGKINEKINA